MASVFTVDAAGGLIIDGKYVLGHGAKIAQDSKTIQAMTSALETIEQNPQSLTAEVKTAIQKAAKEMEALGADSKRFSVIKEALAYAPQAGAGVDSIMGDLVKDPLARKFLSADDLAKLGIKDAKQLDGFIATKEALVKTLKDGGENIKKIEQLFIDNHGAPKEVIDALASTKVDGVTHDLVKIAGGISEKIAADIDKVKGLATTLQKAQLDLVKAKAAGTTGDALKPLETAIADASKGAMEAIKEPHSSKVVEAIKKSDKSLFEALESEKSIASHMQSTLKNAGESAGKTQWGWTNKVAPKAEGFMGAVWKNRGVAGKAAVIAGAGAVGYAIISAIGGKGPGENAEKVRNQQAEPAMGR